jgi:hypothetical protein
MPAYGLSSSMGKSSSGPDVALMPGAAALALISGGSSAMTGIFSSRIRADSDEALVVGWTSVAGTGAAVVGTVAGAMTLSLVFSLMAELRSWVEGCEGRGASKDND